jgi:hypothetical protein
MDPVLQGCRAARRQIEMNHVHVLRVQFERRGKDVQVETESFE